MQSSKTPTTTETPSVTNMDRLYELSAADVVINPGCTCINYQLALNDSLSTPHIAENDTTENDTTKNDAVENDAAEDDTVENDAVENDTVETNIVENNLENSSITRRHFLRNISTIAVTSSTMMAVPASPARAETDAMPQPRSLTRFSLTEKLSTTSMFGLPLRPSFAVIALNRMGFGPREGDVQAFAELGATPDEQLAAYVDQQTDPTSIDDSECDAKLLEQGFSTLDMSIQELWTTYVKPTTEDPENDRQQPLREVRTATFIRGLYSKRQLFEIMTDFWHNHFSVYGWDYWIAPTFSQYDRDVIRANVFGNFRAMLEDVARSPAMLYYLDNQSNEGGDPNENYARELFELHGMGAENYLGLRDPNDPDLFDENGKRIGYIDADVYGSTTCFTGWRVNGETGLFEFDDARHFPFQKIVLGQIFPSFQGIKDGQDVLDLIASHPGTARYICRKLCRRLVADEPPESLVQSAADIFIAQQDAPDQIKQVIRHILLSDDFKTTWGEKIKRPLELTLSMLRSANADFDPSDDFYWWYDQMGQPLFSWRPPNGYPDLRTAWSSTMPMVQRWRFINRMIRWDYDDESGRRRVSFLSQTPGSVNSPKAIIDYWANRILGRTLPVEEQQPIVEYMAGGRNPELELPVEDLQERLPHAIVLIYMSPSFQWK